MISRSGRISIDYYYMALPNYNVGPALKSEKNSTAELVLLRNVCRLCIVIRVFCVMTIRVLLSF